MKRVLAMLACAALAAPLLADSKQVLSPVYGIDRKYKSMEGPSGSQTIYLGDPARPELVWITGMRTEVVGEDGHTPALPELMCHVNIDIDPLMHRTLFHLERMPMARLLTISQGMLAPTGGFTARLPKGFGMPFVSSEPLIVMTQVLNHNLEHPHLRVRHRVTFEYTRDADLQAPLRPLFNLGASAMVVLSDRPSVSVVMADSIVDHGPSCAMPRAPNAKGMSSDYTDAQGRRLTGHWIVPPGRQEKASSSTCHTTRRSTTPPSTSTRSPSRCHCATRRQGRRSSWPGRRTRRSASVSITSTRSTTTPASCCGRDTATSW